MVDAAEVAEADAMEEGQAEEVLKEAGVGLLEQAGASRVAGVGPLVREEVVLLLEGGGLLEEEGEALEALVGGMGVVAEAAVEVLKPRRWTSIRLCVR